MYPNPQDVLPLPPRPDLDQYRKRARELTSACQGGDTALLAWASAWVEALERLQPDTDRTPPRDRQRRAHQVALFARERLRGADAGLSQAYFVMARAHGFESWPRLLEHVEGLAQRESGVAAFERAADAIVNGELATLEQLLRADPGLVRARSSREHRATLLHYVAANGVENYRQRTPGNIVAIAQALLDAGAEVDARAEIYGGTTTFALVVTSAHPRNAGVQDALADLLLDRGARMDPGIVHYCLVNGCPEAAAHLADRGAPVSVEDAAGIGRLEQLRAAFAPPRTVPAAEQGAAMVMAAWCGRRDVIELLLGLGVAAGAARETDRQTALHVASFRGDVAMVALLLRHGAPLDVTDAVYGTPPLVWALHAWLTEQRPEAEAYRRIVLTLVEAGAAVPPATLDDARLAAEPEVLAALRRAAARRN